MATITEPGIYDMPADEYHRDPVPGGSLSSSGARLLLPPSCPAKYRYRMDNPQEYVAEFNLGRAAHKLVLGTGPELVVIDADDWRTKTARAARDEVHAAGACPLLPAEHEQVTAMADALRAHPLAARLFAPGTGRAEQALFWQDKRTGVWLRAQLDWLPNTVPGRRLVIPDYKTAAKADTESVGKAISEYGYHIQGHWYTDGVAELGLAPDGVWFVLVVQEKTPPYLVNVVTPTPSSMFIGGEWAAHAIDIYRRCTETGHWPGYSDDIEPIELPAWSERQYETARARGLFTGETR